MGEEAQATARAKSGNSSKLTSLEVFGISVIIIHYPSLPFLKIPLDGHYNSGPLKYAPSLFALKLRFPANSGSSGSGRPPDPLCPPGSKIDFCIVFTM
jgi:hypothetical protein